MNGSTGRYRCHIKRNMILGCSCEDAVSRKSVRMYVCNWGFAFGASSWRTRGPIVGRQPFTASRKRKEIRRSPPLHPAPLLQHPYDASPARVGVSIRWCAPNPDSAISLPLGEHRCLTASLIRFKRRPSRCVPSLCVLLSVPHRILSRLLYQASDGCYHSDHAAAQQGVLPAT